MAKRKHNIKRKIICNPDTCDNCIYIGEGDSVCEATQNIVLSDWKPTDDYLKGCPFDLDRRAGLMERISDETLEYMIEEERSFWRNDKPTLKSLVYDELQAYRATGLSPERCAELAEALHGEAHADARALFEQDMLLYECHADNPPDLLYKNDTEKLSCMANWRERATFLRLLFPEAERALEGRRGE